MVRRLTDNRSDWPVSGTTLYHGYYGNVGSESGKIGSSEAGESACYIVAKMSSLGSNFWAKKQNSPQTFAVALTILQIYLTFFELKVPV